MPIYFRVYQDKENTDGNSYIIPLSEIEYNALDSINYIKDMGIDTPCVFEPIEMTEEEFENLPEFKGF